MNRIEVLSRVSVPEEQRRPVTLLYKSGGKQHARLLRVAASTYFDEILVTRTRLERQPPAAYVPGPGNLSKWARSTLRQAQRATQKRLPALELGGTLVDLRSIEPNNIAHLLMRVLPICLHARDMLGEGVTFLFRPMVEPFPKLLAQFGIAPTFATRHVSGEFVQYLGSRGLAVYDLATVFDCDSISYLPTAYDRFEFNAPTFEESEKLFVARRGARALRNHQQVEQFLGSRGYKTVYFEDFSIEQQLSLGRHATDIVAIHGAAMSFFLLQAKLKTVVELLPPNVYHQMFPVALPRPVPDYKLVMQDFNPDVGYGNWDEIVKWKNRTFEADMELLEDAVAASPARPTASAHEAPVIRTPVGHFAAAKN